LKHNLPSDQPVEVQFQQFSGFLDRMNSFSHKCEMVSVRKTHNILEGVVKQKQVGGGNCFSFSYGQVTG
jgi:hypothetical protein